MTPAKTIKNLQKGFTLIELLVVIGILAILLAIVLIAINPAKQFGQANDTKRSSDVNSILNSVNQFMADNKGNLPTGLSAANCPTGVGCTISSNANAAFTAPATPGNVNLCAANLLVTTFIADLPVDPDAGVGTRSYTTGNCTQVGATYTTGYLISVSATDNRITVWASKTYGVNPITVTR